jgi:hypothetical protein
MVWLIEREALYLRGEAPSDFTERLTMSADRLSFPEQRRCIFGPRALGQQRRASSLRANTEELIPMIDDIGKISAVFIEAQSARYYFEQLIDGEIIAFPIDFVRENGTRHTEDF